MSRDGGAERLVVRVFPGYGTEWPVWGRRGQGQQRSLSPAHFPDLPAELIEELKDWQRRWEAENPDPWVESRNPRAAEQQAELDRLAQRFAAEVCDVADVQTDTWSSTG